MLKIQRIRADDLQREVAEEKQRKAADERQKKMVLDEYAPPTVIIDQDCQILYFIGQTDKFLRHPTGTPGFDIFTLARQGLRQKLRTAIRTAVTHRKAVISEGARIKPQGNFRGVDIVVRPLTDPPFPRAAMLVVFYERPLAEADRRKPNAVPDKEVRPQIINLEQELYTTKEDLQATLEELDAANEQLKVMNDALQSVNTALQTRNAELQTSKTELQSTNVELATVNSELQTKLVELSRVYNDIDNLLASTEVRAIFLDTALCITRFTPTMKRFFHLLDSDRGRPLSDLTSNLAYDHLDDDLKTVRSSRTRKETEIQTKEGNW